MQSLIDIPPEAIPAAEATGEALARVQRLFDDELSTDLPPVMDLVRHVERYRGKMLRPTLLLLAGLAGHPAAGSPQQPSAATILTDSHVAVAAVCEMVHMATLVHDDVLDEADTRRRGATVNRLRGNEAAVILGDYLIAAAYHLCSRAGSPRAGVAVGRASMTVCSGELLQLHHRDDYSLDEATYFEIVDRKTASLIATAAELGADLSGANDRVCAAFSGFGRAVGIAFQIQDDLLDLTGAEETVGKSVGKDLEKGKMTLPMIHYLATAGPQRRGELLRLIERASDGQTPSHHAAAQVAALLAGSDAVAYSRARAEEYVAHAKRFLEIVPDSAAKSLLLAMSDAVLTRGY
jgi:octaprenyl-diphosphate synthase